MCNFRIRPRTICASNIHTHTRQVWENASTTVLFCNLNFRTRLTVSDSRICRLGIERGTEEENAFNSRLSLKSPNGMPLGCIRRLLCTFNNVFYNRLFLSSLLREGSKVPEARFAVLYTSDSHVKIPSQGQRQTSLHKKDILDGPQDSTQALPLSQNIFGLH